MIAWLFSVALAAPPACEPLPEADLADRIHASLDAIHRADVRGHQAIIEDLEQRLPCLEFVPSPERWAELLVGMAIVEHAQGGDWKAPLATALRVHPGVHLLVGPTHPFRAWTPPAAPGEAGRPVPEGVRIYLDGELVSEVRPTEGLRLAQRRTGDGWSTLLLRGEELPEDWFEEPALAEGAGPRLRIDLELQGGLGRLAQTVDQPGTWLDDRQQTGAAVGGALRAAVGVGSLPGFYVDAHLPRVWTAAGALAHAGVDVPLGPLSAQAGGGVVSHRAVDGDGELANLSGLGVLGLGVGAGRVDGAGQLGWTPGLLRIGARAGFSPSTGTLGARIGLLTWWQVGGWSQPGSDRSVRVTEGGVAVSVGGRLRRDP